MALAYEARSGGSGCSNINITINVDVVNIVGLADAVSEAQARP